MQTLETELWNAWQRLCTDLQVGAPHVSNSFQLFVTRYSEPHRAYHTLAHIKDCLEQFALVRHLCEDPLAVELAIWFHDLIYDVPPRENEVRSGESLLDFAQEAHLPFTTSVVAHKCVLATAHAHEAGFPDAHIMVDVDLSILGRSWDVYETYTKQIRKEYAVVPDVFYRHKRKQIMEKFLQSVCEKGLYHTDMFRSLYEAQAKQNLEREIPTLSLFSSLFIE